MKQVIVTFDCESTYGMPFKNVNYDFMKTVCKLVALLDRHGVRATFFVVGKLLSDFPELAPLLAKHGHEVGLHGLEHKNLSALTPADFKSYAKQLSAVEDKVFKQTGLSPLSFRAPYLAAPDFYNKNLYAVLARHNFACVSNREIRCPAELFVPGRLPIGKSILRFKTARDFLTILLNAGFMLRDNLGLSFLARLGWLTRPDIVKRREGLCEHPVVSPLDCDLVGLPRPRQQTPERLKNYAVWTLCDGFEHAENYYNINCHDWIIGSSNRIEILDEVLHHISASKNANFVTMREYKFCQPTRPAPAKLPKKMPNKNAS